MAAPSSKQEHENTITQIIYLDIPPDQHLDQRGTHAGDQWARALDMVAGCAGFRKLYWGRRLEEPEKVQLHIVWDDLPHGTSFLSSPRYRDRFLPLVRTLTTTTAGAADDDDDPPRVRHAALRHHALADPFGASLLGRPVGTAVYLGAGAAWHEGAWPLWTHVVRAVDGCEGVAGGGVREPVGDGEGDGDGDGGDAYLVYVAWRSVRHHEDYHHTRHFARHRVILEVGVRGWTEYGHVVFEGIRDGEGGYQVAGSRL